MKISRELVIYIILFIYVSVLTNYEQLFTYDYIVCKHLYWVIHIVQLAIYIVNNQIRYLLYNVLL